MAVLTPITRIGDRKYFICDTYANLAMQNPNWSGALCRLDDGSWYEFREFVGGEGAGTWELYSGEPISFSVSEASPLPVKNTLYSSTPLTIYSAISATPTTPYTLVLEGTNYKELKIQTSGTSTSRTITFKGKLESSGAYVPITGYCFTTGNTASSTTETGEIWLLFGFDGMHSVEINVTAIAGGNLTIVGEALY